MPWFLENALQGLWSASAWPLIYISLNEIYNDEIFVVQLQLHIFLSQTDYSF